MHSQSAGMVVNVFAALVFTVLMTVFWWFFASTEMANTVERKADVLRALRAQLAASPAWADAATLLDVRLHEVERDMAQDAEDQRVARRRFNVALTWCYLAPFIAGLLGLLLGLATYNRVMTLRGQPRPFEFGHRAGLAAVFLSYIPEVLFFLFVVEHYTIIGDYEAVQRLAGVREE